MSAVWVSSPALFVITLGFAGLLGESIYRLRAAIQPQMAALAALLVGLVLFPPLSLPGLLNWPAWVLSLAVTAIFATRPEILPYRLRTRSFALRYASVAMLLSAWWYLVSGPCFPACLLAASALLAALLAWIESYKQDQHNGI